MLLNRLAYAIRNACEFHARACTISTFLFCLRDVRIHFNSVQCVLGLHWPQPFFGWTHSYGLGLR